MFASNDRPGNGRAFPLPNLDAAQAIVDFNRQQPQASRDPATRPAAAQTSLVEFAMTLESFAAQNPQLKSQLEEMMARLARQYLTGRDLAAPSTSDFVAMLRSQSVAATRGGTVVRAFWWGFHIQVSHEDLDAALNSANVINTLVGAIGGSIPSPAQPFIVLAATFVAGAISLVRSLDHGNGVYISMSWFAPGVFVPTSV